MQTGLESLRMGGEWFESLERGGGWFESLGMGGKGAVKILIYSARML